MKRNYSHIAGAVESIDLFVQTGRPPGDFVYAVLTNDLKESFMRADSLNRQNLYDIVCYCYSEIPAIAWGSVEKVREWSKGRIAEIKAEGGK
jgi:hypothetical protein